MFIQVDYVLRVTRSISSWGMFHCLSVSLWVDTCIYVRYKPYSSRSDVVRILAHYYPAFTHTSSIEMSFSHRLLNGRKETTGQLGGYVALMSVDCRFFCLAPFNHSDLTKLEANWSIIIRFWRPLGSWRVVPIVMDAKYTSHTSKQLVYVVVRSQEKATNSQFSLPWIGF